MILNLKNTDKRKKIPKLNLKFLLPYTLKTLKLLENPYSKLIPHRNTNVSAIYETGKVYIPQGRTFVTTELNTKKTGLKLGMFAATKKPFNFREKKKKNKR